MRCIYDTLTKINVMIAKYAFNGSIDKITFGFPFAFNAIESE